MNLLVGITYYYPHVSGLTLYVQRLAESLVDHGHQVTVLTSQHMPSLPRRESHNGVEVLRVPAAIRVSKGFLMPGYVPMAWRLLKGKDLVLLNLPYGATEILLPILARLQKRPLVAIYHCAIQLPPGWANRVAQRVVEIGGWIGLSLADRIVGYTEDYANHTPPLAARRRKLHIVPPPVVAPKTDPEAVEGFRDRHAPRGERLIGFAARFATEKGVEIALAALQLIKEKVGPTRILFAGEYQNVVGEEAYWEQMRDQVAAVGDSWEFLGTLNSFEMSTFYKGCEVLILPSVNRTESFGLVQVESMLSGTPVVASNLPGVRIPVTKTGMGRIAEVRDPDSLASAIIEVLRDRNSYLKPRRAIEEHFSIEKSLEGYERLFDQLLGG